MLEEDKGSIFYRHEKEIGFRGLEDIAVFHGVNSGNLLDACCSYVSFGREEPLMILCLGNVASGLIGYGEYAACYKDLAAEAKRFLPANTWLGECILDHMRVWMAKMCSMRRTRTREKTWNRICSMNLMICCINTAWSMNRREGV